MKKKKTNKINTYNNKKIINKMLGFIIYETIDLTYTLGKLTYNGVTSIYYWYFQQQNKYDKDHENIEKKGEILLLEDKIRKLENRLLLLENK